MRSRPLKPPMTTSDTPPGRHESPRAARWRRLTCRPHLQLLGCQVTEHKCLQQDGDTVAGAALVSVGRAGHVHVDPRVRVRPAAGQVVADKLRRARHLRRTEPV